MLYSNLARPVVLLVIILFGGFSSPVLLPLISIFALVLLILIGLIYTNYADDVFILSTRRIIDIERRLIIFYEARTETEYKNVRDTRVDVANIVRRLLDIGNLFIETPGSTPNIEFSNIYHPCDIQDKLQEIMTFKEKADEAEKDNKSRKELNNWCRSVVPVVAEKEQNVGVPNFKNLDF